MLQQSLETKHVPSTSTPATDKLDTQCLETKNVSSTSTPATDKMDIQCLETKNVSSTSTPATPEHACRSDNSYISVHIMLKEMDSLSSCGTITQHPHIKKHKESCVKLCLYKLTL